MKGQKMRSKSANVDRLSVLPDELLAHILSSMPTKSVVRTSILSKRWRHCWTLVHSLDFLHINHTRDSSTFSSFVDRALELCKPPQLKLFRLQICGILVNNPHVPKWINEAVRLNVGELDINVSVHELPLSLFTCKTLTKLSLVMGGCGSHAMMNVPSGVILPCLKTLDIGLFHEPFVSVRKLIRGCPVLESFCLSIKVPRQHDNSKKYKINIPTLKRFELRTPTRTFNISKVILNVPNLEYFIVSGFMCSRFVMEDFPCLVEASVSFYDMEYNHLMVELLKGLFGAKSLSFSTSIRGVSLDSILPIFPNLKHLEVTGCSYSGWSLMLEVLQRSCELEHLCIEEPGHEFWNEPLSVPPCMISHLTTIKFVSFRRCQSDIWFLEYLLANAKVLKTLTIKSNICSPEDELWYEQLLKSPCTSSCCEIQFSTGLMDYESKHRRIWKMGDLKMMANDDGKFALHTGT